MIVGKNDAFMGESGKRASFLSHIADEESDMDLNSLYLDVLSEIESFRGTVVCAIDGHVSGACGVEVIMACDYRVSTSWVDFGGDQDPSVTMLSSQRESWDDSSSSSFNVMNALLSGDVICARDAQQIGLIDELVSGDELLEVACKIARKNRKRHHRQYTRRWLLNYLPEEYLKYRSYQVFNLIRDYPESVGALDELRAAILVTCQQEQVISAIRHQLEDRLLIPGAHTEDVLQMYLRTFKVVSLLFKGGSVGSIFKSIAGGVIEHIHKRSDAVKCIVSTLLDDSPAEAESEEISVIVPDYEDSQWTPPPLEDEVAGQDTMALLIGVYGGKESFLKEFRETLALRLAMQGSFEIDREQASLDLMKTKFGAEPLADCSVMVHDVLESKRLHGQIRSKIQAHLFSAFVLTKHCWPASLCPESDEEGIAFLPPSLQRTMSQFETAFTELKPTQKLRWLTSEGLVCLGIELRGREIEFRVSPVHVQVLSLFQPIGVLVSAASSPLSASAPVALSAEAIAGAIKAPLDKAKSIIQFWSAKGVLREVEINRFVLAE